MQALLDAGSPVSIISLDFLLEALSKQRAEGQSLKEWEESMRARLQNPGMVLKSYGGGAPDQPTDHVLDFMR